MEGNYFIIRTNYELIELRISTKGNRHLGGSFSYFRKEEFAIHSPKITVKDRNLRAIGRLENAYNISVTKRVNALWTASFSLPSDDPKNELCSHLNYVEIVSPSGRYLGLYRIMPTETRKSIEADRIIYRLEHVLATLLDDVIDGLLPPLINRTTRDNLERLLALQTPNADGTRNWRLGDVEFERYFQYSFENENGLLAPIYSIAQPFDEPYEYTFDTTSYPWTLNLVRPSDATRAEIRWGKDMISFDEVSDPTGIVNYIIPKGYGEGVNQLTIEDVNEGKRYLEDRESIEEWGKRSYIWIDRRFKHADSLKESAQALLDEWSKPKISFEVDSVDLSVKPEYAHESKHLNGVVRIAVEDKRHYGRILEEHIADLSKEYEVRYKIANRINDIATIQADIERKQQVNEAYSQGATNILTFQYQDNADENTPARIQFFVDDDVVHINSAELTYDTERFRAYSRATAGGGAIVKSTKGGGGTTRSTTEGGATTVTSSSGGSSQQTSSSGGGTSRSTQSGGGSSQTSAAGGDHRHLMFRTIGFTSAVNTSNVVTTGVSSDNGAMLLLPGDNGAPGNYYTQGSSGNHSHSVSIPAHSHEFSTPNHTHTVNIPAHTHNVTIPAHSHSVTVPDHTHEIELPDHTHDVVHEIIELNRRPSSVEIRVDGNVVPVSSTRGSRIDIADYLERDSNGKIRRGRHVIEILPDDLGRIEAFLVMRVFIQSTLGSQL